MTLIIVCCSCHDRSTNMHQGLYSPPQELMVYPRGAAPSPNLRVPNWLKNTTILQVFYGISQGYHRKKYPLSQENERHRRKAVAGGMGAPQKNFVSKTSSKVLETWFPGIWRKKINLGFCRSFRNDTFGSKKWGGGSGPLYPELGGQGLCGPLCIPSWGGLPYLETGFCVQFKGVI